MATLMTVLIWVGLILPIITFCNGCSQTHQQTTIVNQEQQRGFGFQTPVYLQPPVVVRPPFYFNFGPRYGYQTPAYRNWGYEHGSPYHPHPVYRQPIHSPGPINHGGRPPQHHGGH